MPDAFALMPKDDVDVLDALAKGPIATLSVPVALLSASVELAWKYFELAPPLASAASAEPTSV